MSTRQKGFSSSLVAALKINFPFPPVGQHSLGNLPTSLLLPRAVPERKQMPFSTLYFSRPLQPFRKGTLVSAIFSRRDVSLFLFTLRSRLGQIPAKDTRFAPPCNCTVPSLYIVIRPGKPLLLSTSTGKVRVADGRQLRSTTVNTEFERTI